MQSSASSSSAVEAEAEAEAEALATAVGRVVSTDIVDKDSSNCLSLSSCSRCLRMALQVVLWSLQEMRDSEHTTTNKDEILKNYFQCSD